MGSGYTEEFKIEAVSRKTRRDVFSDLALCICIASCSLLFIISQISCRERFFIYHGVASKPTRQGAFNGC